MHFYQLFCKLYWVEQNIYDFTKLPALYQDCLQCIWYMIQKSFKRADLHSLSLWYKLVKVTSVGSEIKWSCYCQADFNLIANTDRTFVCSKILGRSMIRGERRIKLGCSQFFTNVMMVLNQKLHHWLSDVLFWLKNARACLSGLLSCPWKTIDPPSHAHLPWSFKRLCIYTDFSNLS